MLNRFEKCKNFKDLYNVFANVEGVDNFNNLTEAELERVAVVFEANLPVNAVLPVVPLNDKGYMYIWNVVVEEVETEPIPDEPTEEAVIIEEENVEENVMNETINNATNNNMEGKTMTNETINNTAATTEEATMGQKAKEFAENAKEKLTEGFEYIVENVDGVAEEIKKMANMNDIQLENHLTEKGKEIFDKIMKKVKKYQKDMKDNSDLFPFLKDDADKASNIVELIKATLDEEGLSGWGKFKAIVKELVKWLLRLLLKVGAIVLKLTFTVVVGTIKIGATALVTTGKVVGILNKEVVKPTIKAGKKAWNTHKANMAAKKLEEDFEEETEFFFADDEDAE